LLLARDWTDENRADPWGGAKELSRRRGTYRFDPPSKTGTSVLVVPCNGKANVAPESRRRLRGRATEPLSAVLVCLDPDAEPTLAWTEVLKRGQDRVRQVVASVESPPDPDAEGDFVLQDGTRVASVLWGSPEPPSADLPPLQNLERLVCSAIRDEYPERCTAVRAWLEGRPTPPSKEPLHKAMAWSHMAGWFAENGCEDFYRAIWRDARLAANLAVRLDGLGVLRLVKGLETP
jgi:hypothetical protein